MTQGQQPPDDDGGRDERDHGDDDVLKHRYNF